MNKWNNFETLEHFQGLIWVSKSLKTNNRGNICVYLNDEFKVLAYIEPSQLKNKTLESIILNVVKANGTLWMLET